jgi:hypothetical protein
MPRRLVWIESQNFQGFGCSECNWKFSPSGALAGDSLDEMKRKYEAERDKTFAAHTCVKHTNSPARMTKSIGSNQQESLPSQRHDEYMAQRKSKTKSGRAKSKNGDNNRPISLS